LRRRAIDSALFSSLATGRACRSWYALRTGGLSEIAEAAGFLLAFSGFRASVINPFQGQGLIIEDAVERLAPC
jgi:hypothetical protein